MSYTTIVNFKNVHKRYNPLTDEWVLVSPHRMNRPWQGAQEVTSLPDQTTYDEKCYLCPGNTRVSGEKNPKYNSTYVFQNDFQAINDNNLNEEFKESLFHAKTVNGECRVICYSPDHSKTMALMSIDEIKVVIQTWKEQYTELIKKYEWVQIFENKGEQMGCSNPHPHGQIWASDELPSLVEKEDKLQKKYLKEHDTKLLDQYVLDERNKDERVIVENESFILIVPYWATWPFETLLVSKKSHRTFLDLTPIDEDNLASILKETCVIYDNLFKTSFPYSMGWHGKEDSAWTFHAHFYPPLLRSSTVKKFMVGYEMLAQAQRDMSAERAAQILRELPRKHYLEK